MEYAKGGIGRVFTVRIDSGDDLILGLIKLAELERIESAVFILLGALKEAKLVTGPKESITPQGPVWSDFDDAHEILGI
jgi:predicted DNA-binding protein with PD1-like motif